MEEFKKENNVLAEKQKQEESKLSLEKNIDSSDICLQIRMGKQLPLTPEQE